MRVEITSGERQSPHKHRTNHGTHLLRSGGNRKEQRLTLKDLRTRTIPLCGAFLLASLVAFPTDSFASRHNQAQARADYDRAMRLRAALESGPEDSRKKPDYEKAIAAYRAVYRSAPTYSKAPLAVEAEAELYQEMGRQFSDTHALHNSIAAYEFLIREYPKSSLARQALLAVGEIYRTDLRDRAEATKAFRKYLELYPKSENAADAKEALREIQASRTDSRLRANDSDGSVAEAVTITPPMSVGETRKESLRPAQTLQVTSIRHWVGPNYTRIVIGVEGEVGFDTVRLSSPDRLVFDLTNARPSPELLGKTFPIEDGFLRQIRVALFKPTVTRVVLDVERIEDYSVFPLPNPFRLIIDIHGPTTLLAKAEGSRPGSAPVGGSGSKAAESAKAKSGRNSDGVTASISAQPLPPSRTEPATAGEASGSAADNTDAVDSPGTTGPTRTISTRPSTPPKVPAPTETGSRTLTRALGLKIGRIVIDPGHGGHDTGTIGPSGLTEKDLVLDVGLRLRKLLEQVGSEVVMTRDDDTFIPLEERTAIANQKAADLFISIHANASRDASARGLETYYLNFTSNADALEVAARENATSQESVHQLRDLIKQIALTEKIDESREFATQVEREMHDRLARAGAKQKDRGVKKAPFVVLIGANMPSVLAEISFLTNPRDERLLKQPEYRQKIAQALYQGILRYVNNLGGVRVAEQPQSSKRISEANASLTNTAREARPANRPDF